MQSIKEEHLRLVLENELLKKVENGKRAVYHGLKK